jgi:hypothetical protein
MTAERIFVIGGSGSGKSTLARLIGQRTGLPVHDLDQVARVGGGNGPERSAAERASEVTRIIKSGRWVVEGIHLGWTADLLAAADAIIWLDHVSWRQASGRVVKRFFGGAMGEARRQRGWRRFLRLRDYARELRSLAAAIPETRGYHNADGERADGDGGPTRDATSAALEPYQAKVIHCRSRSDVERALEKVVARSTQPGSVSARA